MEQSLTPPPVVAVPAAPAAGNAALTPVHPRRWTPQRQQAFLQALHALRSVSAAASHAGMSRQSAYRLLHRKRGSAFARAWALALDWRGLPGIGPAAGDAGLQGVTGGDAG